MKTSERSVRYKVTWSEFDESREYEHGNRYNTCSRLFDVFADALDFWWYRKTYQGRGGAGLFESRINRVITTTLTPTEKVRLEEYVKNSV